MYSKYYFVIANSFMLINLSSYIYLAELISFLSKYTKECNIYVPASIEKKDENFNFFLKKVYYTFSYASKANYFFH